MLFGGTLAAENHCICHATGVVNHSLANVVIPAKAGTQSALGAIRCYWVPAFAGMKE